MSSGGKRVSVFDRLGPGNDEGSASSHHRYSSDKHGGGNSGAYGGQDKGRSHSYKEDEAGIGRERKGRHRSSLVDYSEGESADNKLPSLKSPPLKSSRDSTEGVKGTGSAVSAAKMGHHPLTTGEGDFEEGTEEGRRRRSQRVAAEHALSSRSSKHGHGEMGEEDTRRSGRERRDKGSAHSDRSGGIVVSGDLSSHKPSPDKVRSRRESAIPSSHEYKRRREEEVKLEPVVGYKRRRDLQEDAAFVSEAKKLRHPDHTNRELDHHHHTSSGKEGGGGGDHHQYLPSGSGSGKESDRHRAGSSERTRRLDSGTSISSESSSKKRTRQSQTPESPGSGGQSKSGGTKSYCRHSRGDEDKRTAEEINSEHSKVVGDGGGEKRSLDWNIVRNFTERANSKLQHVCPQLLQQFKPGTVLADMHISASLAGPEYQHVQMAIAKDGGQDEVRGNVVWKEDSEGGDVVLDEECEGGEEEVEIGEECEGGEEEVELGEAGKGEVVLGEECEGGEGQQSSVMDWEKVVGECLVSCRRALTASDSYAIRRLLRKEHQGFLGSTRPPPDPWTADQYQLSVELYNNATPTKPQGKLKLLPSQVGILVISR